MFKFQDFNCPFDKIDTSGGNFKPKSKTITLLRGIIDLLIYVIYGQFKMKPVYMETENTIYPTKIGLFVSI